ncbi:MAG: hypothetical protein AAGH89_19650, partial [Verrucomicrobiota bacterium]
TDWIDTIAGIKIARRVAMPDESGERIYLLDSVPINHHYVRLELVGAIADALLQQDDHRDRTGGGANEQPRQNDDARRARDALRQGIRTVTIYRYARSRGISPGAQPPADFILQGEDGPSTSIEFYNWQTLPGEVGPFFVDFLVGSTGPLSGTVPVLARPPSTTMEIFRPRWYEDPALWREDPVPGDFADDLIEIRPILTDVLGIGSLVPWLAKLYPFDVAKTLVGGWVGDRWALWQFPDGSSALLLEIRWQDEESALQFLEAAPIHPSQHLLPHETGSHRVRLLRSTSLSALEQLTLTLSANR